MKKVIIDKDNCIGCGACPAVEDRVFYTGDDGLAEVYDTVKYDELDEDTKNNVGDAIDGCPTGAISIQEN